MVSYTVSVNKLAYIGFPFNIEGGATLTDRNLLSGSKLSFENSPNISNKHRSLNTLYIFPLFSSFIMVGKVGVCGGAPLKDKNLLLQEPLIVASFRKRFSDAVKHSITKTWLFKYTENIRTKIMKIYR